MTPEQRVKHHISGYLEGFKRRGLLDFWWNDSKGTWSQSKKIFLKKKGKYELNGVSDIIVILRGGTTVFIEVKSEKGRLTESQAKFRDRIRKVGSTFIMAKAISDVSEVLEPLIQAL